MFRHTISVGDDGRHILSIDPVLAVRRNPQNTEIGTLVVFLIYRIAFGDGRETNSICSEIRLWANIRFGQKHIMEDLTSMNDTKCRRFCIQAVLVLYRRKPSESEAFTSLKRIFEGNPDIAQSIGLLLYDNSPGSEVSPEALPEWVEYVHNPNNGGLTAAYSEALHRASARNIRWLMLLDQDTTLTKDYLVEAVASMLKYNGELRIAAIVPRLIERGRISSPSTRRLIRDRAVPTNVTGLAQEKIAAFNSGAIIRVASLELIGGFPIDFPIEALDHAVFHLLQESGGKILILEARMKHSLSMNNLGDSMPVERYKRVLAAEALFVKKYGSVWDHVRIRIRFFILAIKQLERRKERKFIPITLTYLLGLGSSK